MELLELVALGALSTLCTAHLGNQVRGHSHAIRWQRTSWDNQVSEHGYSVEWQRTSQNNQVSEHSFSKGWQGTSSQTTRSVGTVSGMDSKDGLGGF